MSKAAFFINVPLSAKEHAQILNSAKKNGRSKRMELRQFAVRGGMIEEKITK